MSPAVDGITVERPAVILAHRAASVPDAIARLLSSGLEGLDGLRLGERRWVVTAAGIAEGPALFLTQLLGERARFVPLSCMATSPVSGDALVVFSQGLSPNARIALAAAPRFRDTVLFTSARADALAPLHAHGVRTVTLEPRDPEDGMLLRVVGPAVARAAALLFARAIEQAEQRSAPEHDVAAAVYAAALRAERLTVDAERLLDPVVFIAQCDDVRWCRALTWKWMEGLWTLEPPVFDVLQFAHGPLQAVHGKRTTVITLSHGASSPLFARLEQVLDPVHHTLVRSEATLPGPLAAFEHDVVVNALLVRAVAASRHDLPHWPGRDCDGPLYGLDAPVGS